MIKVFYGDDRVKAKEEIVRFLGEEYEVVEGVDLTAADLPSLLMGGTLFAAERAILVRDVLANGAVAENLVKYLDTPHRVVIWELKVDKRSAAYKALKDKAEWREFKRVEDANRGVVFDVYQTAKRDGARAVEMLRRIEAEQEPMMFVGLMVTQAVRDYATRPGEREKKALTELSKLDMELKLTQIAPWLLIEGFLMRLGA